MDGIILDFGGDQIIIIGHQITIGTTIGIIHIEIE
jgi:hypothetical protein